MGGDYKSQLDRDRAAAAVRAQRQANRDAGKNVAGAKSGTDPQGGMFTPGAVTTKSYNNALTKQFARPAGQGKGLDIMGKPLQQPVQRKVEPAMQTPQPAQAAQSQQSWVGQNTSIPAVQRKAQAQQTQQPQQQTQQPTQQTVPQQTTPQPAAQTTATTGTSAPATTPAQTQPAQTTGKIQGIKQKIDPAHVKEFDGIIDVTPKLHPHVMDAKARVWVKTGQGWQNGNRTIERDDSTYITFDNAWREANGFPTAEEGTMMGSPAPNAAQLKQMQQTQQAPQTTDRPNPYMTPQANTPSEPEQQTQTMPDEPVKIGGQKLNPNDPTDAKILQMIQKQLPQMPTPQVAAVKNAADKTLKRRRNKPKKRF
jgi:hypothetical protein